MNKKTQEAWDAGLEVLKPSRKDLEHGIELHAGSVVVDAYGFSPGAAMDNDVLAAAIASGASPLEIQDLREDMLMTRKATDPQEKLEFREAWDAAGVTCVFQNAGEEGQAVLRLLKRLAHYVFCSDLMRDFCPKAVTPADILAAKAQGHHCFYLSLNGVPLPEHWVSVEDELRYISVFFQLGARMMHLTYNRRNMIGDGCAELANAGLSDFGRTVLREMNRVGVVADVAHSGWQTSLEAARASTRPVVASHSVCCAVNEHPRGKPDEVIRALVDSGGYIGICCIPVFLGGNGDLVALLDHIDYAARKFGVEHVAIGTDAGYQSAGAPGQAKKLPAVPRARPGWESFWPDHVPLTNPRLKDPKRALSLAWTNWPLYTVGLVQRGYTDDDIRSILGGNVVRVATAVLPDCMR